MKTPKTFIPKKSLDKKTQELLNSKPKKKADSLSERFEKVLEEFNDLYHNKKVCCYGDTFNLKKAAEYAYALAMLSKKMEDYHSMEFYANKSIEIYKVLNVQTMEDACPLYRRIEGVEIPDLMHEGVVKRDTIGDK